MKKKYKAPFADVLEFNLKDLIMEGSSKPEESGREEGGGEEGEEPEADE